MFSSSPCEPHLSCIKYTTKGRRSYEVEFMEFAKGHIMGDRMFTFVKEFVLNLVLVIIVVCF